MRRSTRSLLNRGIPLLAVGAVALMLIPGGPVGAIHSAQVGTPVTGKPSVAAANAAPATVVNAAVVDTPSTPPLPAVISTASAAEDVPPLPLALQTASLTQSSLASSSTTAAASVQWSTYETPAGSSAPVIDTSSFTDGRIGTSNVNARSGPSVGSGKLFVLGSGEAVKLGETNGGWVHVYRQDGEDGWVYQRYIAGHEPVASAPDQAVASAPTAPASRWSTGSMARVAAEVPLLSAPGGRAALVEVLEPGDRFRVTDTRGAWMRVVTDDGLSGWIPA